MSEKGRPGWVVFAAILMFGIGGFTLLSAIADFVNPGWIEGLSIFGDRLNSVSYGIIDLIIALVAFYAGFDILQGGKTGYWLGIIFSTLNVLRWFLFMPGAPILALTMTFVWTLVAYGLAMNQDYFDLDRRSRSFDEAAGRRDLG
jgi:hypothetical protein